jgi:dihydropteroate synthase
VAKDTIFSTKKTLNLKGKLMDLSTPIVMGILNITPDSFHIDSRISSDKKLLNQAETMLSQGATILDIGGYSSRPNATNISEEEELQRVIPAIEKVTTDFPEANISIDTFRSVVAQSAIEAGACIINDISGGTLDDEMYETVAKNQVTYIMMHMRGTPSTMSSLTTYDNVLMEMMDFFLSKINHLQSLGVSDIILDPGFGFAKTTDQNYHILKNLQYFKQLKLPLLAGISRKSMIYKSLSISAEEALNGTSVLNTLALSGGAQILRVHDVKEAIETIKLYKATYP